MCPPCFYDVAATECYVKVSFPPYLLELDIDGYIDFAQHKARVEKGILVVKLKKKSDNYGIWGSLGQRLDRKCDPKVRARREQSIKEKLKWEEEVSHHCCFFCRSTRNLFHVVAKLLSRVKYGKRRYTIYSSYLVCIYVRVLPSDQGGYLRLHLRVIVLFVSPLYTYQNVS